MTENKSIICLGMFDGVHAGHQALLREAVRLAAGERPVVAFTFLNHPAELFSGQVSTLSANTQRMRWLKENGADEVWAIPFDRAFAALPPETFVERLLAKRPAEALVAGFNYTFGASGAGTAGTLTRLGEAYGFRAVIVPPVMFEGEPVSSTRIREAVSKGQLDKAEQMLTRPYTLYGPVVGNRQIGRRLGFPTANTDTGKMLLPPDGVYASRAYVNGTVCRAVTNIGTNPTVGGDKRTVETHIIDFTGDLYGETPEIALMRYLRPEQTFPDEGSLKNAIEQDIAAALSL